MAVKPVGLASIAIVCWAGAAAAQTPFSPPEKDFSVSFAATPTIQPSSPVDQTVGSFRRYAAEQAGERFDLTVDAYPPGFRAPTPTEAIYQRLAWAHAREPGVTMMSERPAMLSGLAGWEGTYRLSTGQVEVRRILMVGPRIYQLSDTAAQTGAGEIGANAEAFFASFKISTWALPRWQEPSRSAS